MAACIRATSARIAVKPPRIGASEVAVGTYRVSICTIKSVIRVFVSSGARIGSRLQSMNVLPDRDHETIQFCDLHQPVWAEHAERLGLDSARLELLSVQTLAAREAFQAAQAAREAAKAATITLDATLAALRATAATCVKTIKANAASDDSPSQVYALAQIPEPARPTPLGAPGAARTIAINLVPGGGVRLTWAAKDASRSTGAVFEVLRRTGSASDPLVVIGLAQGGPRGKFSFVDEQVPGGAGSGETTLAYMLRPRRGTVFGASSPMMVVSLGSQTPGGARGRSDMRIAA
jgi:hypothetical protein